MALFAQAIPHDGPVPDIFEICLSHLELHALETEGIFRISGQKLRIDELKTEFETGKRYEFKESDDVHDVAGLFRLWLHLLPEPIIPYEFHHTMVEYGKMDRKKARTPLKELADKLPPLRRLMLQKLIRLLRLLSLYCETNKMTANNLAVVMAPNICRPFRMEMSVEALAEAQAVINAVISLIMDYEYILPREPPSADKHLAHVKRKSRVENILLSPLVSSSSSPLSSSVRNGSSASSKGRPADDIVSVKEAEDAIDSKLSLSLSDLKPDIVLAEPNSARGAPSSRARQRGQCSAAARSRGFSNALEWLVTSVQDDVLDDVIAEESDDSIHSSSSKGKAGSRASLSPRETLSTPSLLSPNSTTTSTTASRKRMSRKSKTTNEGTTSNSSSSTSKETPESPREISTASTSTNGSDTTSISLNISAGRRERTKKLRTESSGNSASGDGTSSTSEPPSPRDSKSTGSNGSSGSKKKKSKQNSNGGDSPRGMGSATDDDSPVTTSQRRRIPPPSRESSVN